VRNLYRKIDSSEVQGEGSWVKLSKLTVREINESDEQLADKGNIPYSLEMLREHVIEWNWTDEKGVALPQPTEDGAIDDLTDDEFQFRCSALVGRESELKN
jgi:hypothetical protein